jgi:hypothetical protein
VKRREQQLWSRLAQYGFDSFSYTPRGHAAPSQAAEA